MAQAPSAEVNAGQGKGSEVAGQGQPAVSGAAIGDAERSALTFLAYDLAVQLRPADGGLAVLARVTVRNDGGTPLSQVALEISSTLRWDVISEQDGGRTEKLAFSQHLLQTDADGTGEANEAVLHLPRPLAAKGTAELTLLYSGAIRASAPRLGAGGVLDLGGTGSGSSEGSLSGSSESGSSGSGGSGGSGAGGLRSSESGVAAWDEIGPGGTFLRGYGNVLWYPTASPQVFLGEGASFLHTAGMQRSRQAAASMRLRVSVMYAGEAPAEVFFCGRQEPLKATNDDENAPVAEGAGVATAEFPTEELGFRTPSLFLTGRAVPGAGGGVGVVSGDAGATERVSAAAEPVLRMLTEWMGPSPRALTVIDHAGAPFADRGLLVAPVGTADASALTSTLVPALSHARFRSSHVWLDEGVAQLMSLLWVEGAQGRAAAIGAMEQQSHALALAESAEEHGQTRRGSPGSRRGGLLQDKGGCGALGAARYGGG